MVNYNLGLGVSSILYVSTTLFMLIRKSGVIYPFSKHKGEFIIV